MPDTITLYTSGNKQVTCVSNSFIDNFMADADGEYVKIYIYLLRILGEGQTSFSIVKMADILGHTERDIRKALSYWESQNLLKVEYDSDRNPTGICLLDPDSSDIPLTVNLTKCEQAPSVKDDLSSGSNIAELSASEIEELSGRSESQELLYVTEKLLGRPLNRTEIDTILSWLWLLSLPVDVLECMVEQCVNAGHTSIRYMNTVALSWKEKGIKTEEEARCKNSIHSRAYYTVLKAFGINNRGLNETEESFLDRWINEYAFSDDILRYACEKALAATGKASFTYAEKCLSDWYKKGVKSIKDIQPLEKDLRYQKISSGSSPLIDHGFQEHTYTPEELADIESHLMNFTGSDTDY